MPGGMVTWMVQHMMNEAGSAVVGGDVLAVPLVGASSAVNWSSGTFTVKPALAVGHDELRLGLRRGVLMIACRHAGDVVQPAPMRDAVHVAKDVHRRHGPDVGVRQLVRILHETEDLQSTPRLPDRPSARSRSAPAIST